ncbi:MAG: hypothetical protein ACI85U_003310 [Candidatus Promineifilaceae bacterium]|jgi:hypothetical protein
MSRSTTNLLQTSKQANKQTNKQTNKPFEWGNLSSNRVHKRIKYGNYSGAPPAYRGYVIFVNKNGSPRNPILLLTGRATPLGVT